MVEGDVLRESILNEASSHEPDEVKVEPDIDNTEDGLFGTIPNIIDIFPCLVDLKSGRNPNDEDADVDNQDDGKDRPLQSGDM